MSSNPNTGWTKPPHSKNADWNDRFSNRPPHVFVGICSFGEIPHEIYLSHVLWALQAGKHYSGRFAVSFGMATRSEQYRARNKLIREAHAGGADFLLMIDDDQTLHECPDIIDKFYELGQPIAGGLYYNRGGAYWPVVMKEFKGPNGLRNVRFMRHEELPTEPAPVDVLGGGCHWVDMRVFDKLKEPHFWPFPAEDGGGPLEVYYPDPRLGLDVHFCMKARDKGYECWLHPDVKLGHLRHEREIITHDSLPALEELQDLPERHEYIAQVMGAIPNERTVQ
jgi:hypothetical protein